MRKLKFEARSRKKLLLVLLFALLIVYISYIFGETSVSETFTQPKDEALTNSKITITCAFSTLSENEAFLNYINSLQTANVNIEILSIPQDEYNSTLNKMMLEGKGPDFFEISPIWLGTYLTKQWVAPLQAVTNNNDFQVIKKLSAPIDKENHVFATHMQSVWMVANEDLLKSCGFEQPPTTLESFRHVTEEISRLYSGYGKYGFLLPLNGNEDETFYMLEHVNLASSIKSYSWEFHQYDFEKMNFLLATLQNMRKSNAISPDYALATEKSSLAQFIEGNIGVLFVNLRDIKTIKQNDPKFNFSVSLPPAENENSQRVIAQTPSGYLGVNARSTAKIKNYIPELFGIELVQAVGSEDNYISILNSDEKAYKTALNIFADSDLLVSDEWIENNVYSYQRFSIYKSIFEEELSSNALKELSQNLSINEGIRRKSKE